MSGAKLLIKLPSRERPDLLLKVAGMYAGMCADKENTRILISVDDDDVTFTPELHAALKALPVEVIIPAPGKRVSKIEAVNRDLPGLTPWDVLMAASDDHWPQVHGYDSIIKNTLLQHFPDTDGCAWFHDGRQQRLCTLSIMGRKAFERTGWVYQPGYKSYYSDDEWTEYWISQGKLMRDPRCVIRDEHCQWHGAVPDDALYEHNRKAKAADKTYYQLRRAAGFP